MCRHCYLCCVSTCPGFIPIYKVTYFVGLFVQTPGPYIWLLILLVDLSRHRIQIKGYLFCWSICPCAGSIYKVTSFAGRQGYLFCGSICPDSEPRYTVTYFVGRYVMVPDPYIRLLILWADMSRLRTHIARYVLCVSTRLLILWVDLSMLRTHICGNLFCWSICPGAVPIHNITYFVGRPVQAPYPYIMLRFLCVDMSRLHTHIDGYLFCWSICPVSWPI